MDPESNAGFFLLYYTAFLIWGEKLLDVVGAANFLSISMFSL
jgi:hypothetical protein